jgi:1-acyl-sn-glycerol-3-phosphate acyltransferase
VESERGSGRGAESPGSSWASASLATRRALAFGSYFLAGMVAGYVVIPLQRLARRLGRPGDPELQAQWAIHWVSRCSVRIMQILGVVRVRWRGVDRLRQGPVLVVANHPSLIDTPLLTCQLPQATFIVSPDWAHNPMLSPAVAGGGYLLAEHGSKVVREAVARLRVGRSVVVYPEGSRTPVEGLRPFHRGAAHVALEAGFDLLPVVIRVEPRTLMKGQHWADAPLRAPLWTVEVGEPIHPADHLDGTESRPVAARRLTGILQDYFDKRWHRGDS